MVNKSGGIGQLLLLFTWKRWNILKATAGAVVGDILQVLLGTASLLK
jgi:hypothetical protein